MRTRLQREAYNLIEYTLQLTNALSKNKWYGITMSKHTMTHHNKLRTTDNYTRLIAQWGSKCQCQGTTVYMEDEHEMSNILTSDNRTTTEVQVVWRRIQQYHGTLAPSVCCLFVSSYSLGAEYWIKYDPLLPSKLEKPEIIYKYNNTIKLIYILFFNQLCLRIWLGKRKLS